MILPPCFKYLAKFPLFGMTSNSTTTGFSWVPSAEINFKILKKEKGGNKNSSSPLYMETCLMLKAGQL